MGFHKSGGDFRYRYEYIDQQDNEISDRSRLRSRINFSAKANETVKVGLRLASGSDDPVSTNQTFDNFATTKRIGLDRGFVEWTPAEGFTIIAGKTGAPFYKPNKASWICLQNGRWQQNHLWCRSIRL